MSRSYAPCGNVEALCGRVEWLLPPDRQIRRLNKLNTAGFAILGLDLAIQAERKAHSVRRRARGRDRRGERTVCGVRVAYCRD